MKSTGCMQADRGALRSRFCVDVLSELSLPMLAQRHCVCSLNAFASRFALHSSPYLRAGSSRAFAQADVRSNVQMDCPERAMPQAWLALVGRQAARDAAPPRHRSPVPSGRGKVQGKIKGHGTLWRRKRVCTWGWRGTPILAAPCRWLHQSRVGIDEAACLLRRRTAGLEGVTP